MPLALPVACTLNRPGPIAAGPGKGPPWYCDHQENRKSIIGRDHLKCTQRGITASLYKPAARLKTGSGLYTSRWAEDSQSAVYQPMGCEPLG